MDFCRIAAALALGSAFVVPTLLPASAMAQGRSDRDGRHDNGQHRGWDKNGKRDGDRRDDRSRDRRDDRRWDRDRGDDSSHRQNTKNTWRNLGLAGGVAGVAGLLTGNRTLAALGLGGGLYSAYRYEQDRKSQNHDDHSRYELFRRSSFDHDGHHYERRERTVKGQRNYYFARTR